MRQPGWRGSPPARPPVHASPTLSNGARKHTLPRAQSIGIVPEATAASPNSASREIASRSSLNALVASVAAVTPSRASPCSASLREAERHDSVPSRGPALYADLTGVQPAVAIFRSPRSPACGGGRWRGAIPQRRGRFVQSMSGNTAPLGKAHTGGPTAGSDGRSTGSARAVPRPAGANSCLPWSIDEGSVEPPDGSLFVQTPWRPTAQSSAAPGFGLQPCDFRVQSLWGRMGVFGSVGIVGGGSSGQDGVRRG